MIQTKNLTREYTMGQNKVVALDNCSINISKGELVAIMGKSGSGKTTLLNILGGVDKATNGSVFIDQTEITKLSDTKRAEFRRDKIGFVFQGYNLIPEMTALENIVLPILLAKKTPDKAHLDEIAETLDLKDRLTHYPHQLSGGQQQRVAIARAVINRPPVLLCDEPTGNLDSQSGENVIALLKTLAKNYGITLVVVTHDMGVAMQMDRIINIADGRVKNE